MNLYDLPAKRMAIRRASPCGTVGRLSRGFNRAQVLRCGDTSDAGAGQPNLKPASIYRAGETPTCGGCTFQTIYSTTLYAGSEQGPLIYTSTSITHIIDSTIPWDTFGNRELRVSATLDARSPTATDPDHAGEVLFLITNPGVTITYGALGTSALFGTGTTLTIAYQDGIQLNDQNSFPALKYTSFINPGTGSPLILYFFNDKAPIHDPLTTTTYFQNVNITVQACI